MSAANSENNTTPTKKEEEPPICPWCKEEARTARWDYTNKVYVPYCTRCQESLD